jgi:glycosyltransferase involved in cell wall biosynthesis
MKKAPRNIGIITKPIGKAGFAPLSNLVEIVSSFSDSTYLITGKEGMNLSKKKYPGICIEGVPYKYWSNICIRTLNHIFMQLRISLRLMKLAQSVDIWIFFLDSHALLLPVVTAKLMRKKIIFALTASLTKSAKLTEDTLAKVLVCSEAINYKLSTCVILYSQNLIKEWNLEKYKDKIYIAHRHFLDFDKFTIRKKLDERDILVGYVGRLSEEKGILNFVYAIPAILKERGETKFLIGGEGQLLDKIKKYLVVENLNKHVELAGWVPHDELPDYLNMPKLIVLPSYTEGLPNIMLEAMACGTPVLATPVGAIPDVIKDEGNGFIMKNNSPECIAKNVMMALEYPGLERIVKNARELVEKEFTHDAVVHNYKGILENI